MGWLAVVVIRLHSETPPCLVLFQLNLRLQPIIWPRCKKHSADTVIITPSNHCVPMELTPGVFGSDLNPPKNPLQALRRFSSCSSCGPLRVCYLSLSMLSPDSSSPCSTQPHLSETPCGLNILPPLSSPPQTGVTKAAPRLSPAHSLCLSSHAFCSLPAGLFSRSQNNLFSFFSSFHPGKKNKLKH